MTEVAAPVEDGFRLLFAANPLPMWLYDAETLQFLEVNDAAVAHYGYCREEFLGMRITDLRSPEDAERLIADLRHAPAGLRRWTDMRHRLGDGRVRDVEIAAHTLEFRGRPAVLVVAFDVTDRKRAERALIQSEARKAAILDAALDCIISIDAEGCVVDFNPAAERTFGYSRASAIGRPIAELIIPPELRAEHREGLHRLRTTGEHRVLGRRIEMRAMRSDGTEFPAELAITAVDGAGDVLYTAYLREITERKAAEEALWRLNTELDERVRDRTAQLQAAVDELEAFSYSVSHDLRAPLRSIDGFSQALVEDAGAVLPGEARQHLRRICAATERMAQLIDDLLTLSKVSRGEMRREEIDVSALATRLVAERRRHAPARPLTATVAPGMVATGDPRLLRIALENLLDNAWKFTSRRDEACIEVGQITDEDGHSVFYVRDNGAGFDPAYGHKLFVPFQRLHAADEFPGTGIGLATVRRVVHRHGGRVWAEGQPEQGACFFFTVA